MPRQKLCPVHFTLNGEHVFSKTDAETASYIDFFHVVQEHWDNQHDNFTIKSSQSVNKKNPRMTDYYIMATHFDYSVLVRKTQITNIQNGTLASLLFPARYSCVIMDGKQQILSHPGYPVSEMFYHLFTKGRTL